MGLFLKKLLKNADILVLFHTLLNKLQINAKIWYLDKSIKKLLTHFSSCMSNNKTLPEPVKHRLSEDG